MMFGQGGPVKVFVATRPVDFRKGIDGLALAVQEMFGMIPRINRFTLEPYSCKVSIIRSSVKRDLRIVCSPRRFQRHDNKLSF